MELKNFRQANANSAKPAGPCELGGVPAHCFFDRSGVGLAWITIRASMEHGAPLPAALAGVRTLTVLGKSVPVSVVKLDCGAEALRGSVDPELVQAVLDAAPDPGASKADVDPGAESRADADPGSGPAQRHEQDPGQAQDQAGGPAPTPAAQPAAPAAVAGVGALIAKLRELEPVAAEIQKASAEVKRLERLERTQVEELGDTREELAAAKAAVAELQARMAGVGPQIREILDRERI